jgi:hypothetical protein
MKPLVVALDQTDRRDRRGEALRRHLRDDVEIAQRGALPNDETGQGVEASGIVENLKDLVVHRTRPAEPDARRGRTLPRCNSNFVIAADAFVRLG